MDTDFKNSNAKMVHDNISCDCEIACNCSDSYHFTVSGNMGFGSLDYGEDSDGKGAWFGSFCGVDIESESISGIISQVDRAIENMWLVIG